MRILLPIVLVLLTACAGVSPRSAHLDTIPLRNPGFEVGGGVDGNNPGVARHWQNLDGRSHPGWYAIDTEIKRSGRASQRMEYIPGVSNPHGIVWQFTPEGSITPGNTYRAGVWCRTEGITGASELWGWLHLAVRFFGPGQVMLGEHRAERIEPVNHDWQPVSVTATAPEGASYLQFLVYLHTEAGTFWYDDARVVEVGTEEEKQGP